MGRWDPPPPTGLQRWIARHVVGLQIGLGCLAAATATLLVVVVRAQGWDIGAVSAVGSIVVFLLLVRSAREVARYVADSDLRHRQSDS